MSTQEPTDDDGVHRPTVVVGLVVALAGVAIVGTLAYVDLTTTVTESEYEAFAGGCDGLANETRLVDGGLGMETEELDRSDAAACRNTSFAEYREGRRESLGHTPIGVGQWVLYGGVGLLFVAGGGGLLRRQLSGSN